MWNGWGRGREEDVSLRGCQRMGVSSIIGQIVLGIGLGHFGWSPILQPCFTCSLFVATAAVLIAAPRVHVRC